MPASQSAPDAPGAVAGTGDRNVDPAGRFIDPRHECRLDAALLHEAPGETDIARSTFGSYVIVTVAWPSWDTPSILTGIV